MNEAKKEEKDEIPEELAQTLPCYDHMFIRHACGSRIDRMDIEYVSEEAINKMIQEYYREKCIVVPNDNVNVYVYCDKANIEQRCRCGCSPG